MDDGLVLRADIFRPEEGRHPVILSYGPYAKGLAFQDGYPSAWQRMVAEHPDVAYASTNKYQSWEVVDPEKWVPEGYACVRVDSRGAGRSPGYIDPFSPRETKDFYLCIEWAGVQRWSNGKVGLNGISYYGINQWHVASLQPPHLAAMCIWEGAADWYRDMTHHGGILSTFWANWYDMQVKTVQYGLGERGPVSRVAAAGLWGDEPLSDEELQRNRCDFGDDIIAHPLDDGYHKGRSPVWEKITVPLLSAANWGGQGLHPRGNFEGFVRAASKEKWLEAHGIEHWTHFYTDYGRTLQKRFFDYTLKDTRNGWDRQPRVQLQVRHVDRFVERHENEWPIARTRWTKFHLDPACHSLGPEAPKAATSGTYDAPGDGVTFISAPLQNETEITGPIAARLFVASSTADADLFLVFRVFSPDMREVVFMGAIDPHTPIAQGWLRDGGMRVYGAHKHHLAHVRREHPENEEEIGIRGGRSHEQPRGNGAGNLGFILKGRRNECHPIAGRIVGAAGRRLRRLGTERMTGRVEMELRPARARDRPLVLVPLHETVHAAHLQLHARLPDPAVLHVLQVAIDKALLHRVA